VSQAMMDTTPELAETRYVLGSAWLQRAKTLSGDDQRSAYERAREHLSQASRMQPRDATAHFFLAHALEALGQMGPALVSARAARSLAPTRPRYAEFEARLDLQAGDRQAAVQALEPFAFQSWLPDIAQRHLAAIAAIQAGRPTVDVLKLLSKPQAEP
jgi:Flp pilus assembly protein TadD